MGACSTWLFEPADILPTNLSAATVTACPQPSWEAPLAVSVSSTTWHQPSPEKTAFAALEKRCGDEPPRVRIPPSPVSKSLINKGLGAREEFARPGWMLSPSAPAD